MSVQEEALRLPRPEKLRLMEALWTDLSLVEEDYESPAWHELVLRETEARLAAGEEQQVDWDEAKRRLRTRP
ncbi:addiction module antitoxin RelB [Haloferula helveola]|uniref:Addiction module antitoxin RelB n=1 Tax=Haloferula helveola TaxID=490095 RepID=A0ABN6H3C8_9BACT|nr:addiction module antitoxin RelB [Haloferula helveola]